MELLPMEMPAFYAELEEILKKEESKAVFSIKIIEEDDGTFDIRIWDEKENEAVEGLEEGHFRTFDEADVRLQQIVLENKEVRFLRLPNE